MSLTLLYTVYNRAHLLTKSLERLTVLTWPDDILIVDDGSSDGCESVVNRFKRVGLPIRYVYTHQPYQAMCSHARNVGLRNTDADLVLTSEPEMLFETDVVAQFLAEHALRPNDMLNAGTIHHEHPDWDPPCVTTTENWTATWVAMYERQWLLDIGGWDEGFEDPWGWDDTDLVTRVCANHGCTIMLDVVATHQWHETRHYRQDRNEAHFQAKMSGDGCMELVANTGRDWGAIKPR